MPNIPIHIEPSTDTPLGTSRPSTVDEKQLADQLESSQVPSATASSPDGEDAEFWRDRALRLQAEIENYRKRQRHLAEEQIATERQRLLNAFVHIADDLRRALGARESDVQSLRQGVELTYRNLVHLLDQEGVEPIEAQGERFNPTLHEAIATVPHAKAGVQPQTVVEVAERGYLLGDRLLRPARVVVAV